MTDTDPKTPAAKAPARKASGARKASPKTSPAGESSPPAGGATRGPGRPSNREKLVGKLTGSISSPGVALIAVGMARGNELLAADGQAIVNGAEPLAEALVKLGEENAAVMRALERMQEVSAYGAVFAAVMGIAVPIATNHGLIPAFAPAPAPDQQPAAA